jgi:hypothetical protein
MCSAPVCVGPKPNWPGGLRFGSSGRVGAVRRKQPAVPHSWQCGGFLVRILVLVGVSRGSTD